MRSVSNEGQLQALDADVLERDWQQLDSQFRRHYLIFGRSSGTSLSDANELALQLARLPSCAEAHRPPHFIGYAMKAIQRITIYEVKPSDFAHCRVFEPDERGGWKARLQVS